MRMLHLNSFVLHYSLLDSDIDNISIRVQFIIDEKLLFLGIACLILFLLLVVITKHLQISVTVHCWLVI